MLCLRGRSGSDGYIAVGTYAVILLLLLAPVAKSWIWIPLITIAVLAAVANVLGARDIMRLGSYCLYYMLTTVLSPVLVWAVWRMRR